MHPPSQQATGEKCGIGALSGQSKEVEIFFNQFAGDLLVPPEDFLNRLPDNPHEESQIETLAARYSVSRKVVLRKFLDRGLVSSAFNECKAREWVQQQETDESRTGGNYYENQAAYLGDRYLKLAFSRYYQGSFSIKQLAEHSNVKVSSIPGLEVYGLR